MFWTEEVAAKCSGPQIINDSKTPSGRVHVGALRGVLIHDAIFKTLKAKGIEARYLFGVDDYDPLDEIPAGKGAHFEQYLGQPLCNVPPPDGSSAPDMAEHYMGEFWEIFAELGVEVERYRMRDIYRSGRFNEAIDTILKHADIVRRVYKQVSNSDRPATWYPFQAVCEQCGRIGTTEVSAYDGTLVSYRCRPDMVKWAKGCGHEGRVSPFDGKGKLPWKLEWVAKWVTFPVTIEGAGKDHSTKGGSRDVAAACLKEIFHKPPPLNVPYEFFLVGGAKMSSSRGVGASARDMADLLPPEVLRFLMIRTKPNSPVNFEANEDGIVKLFNEFDRYAVRVNREQSAKPEEAAVFRLAETKDEGDYLAANFQLVSALVQMPHLQVETEIAKRAGRPLTEVEARHLADRIRSARVWVERFAAEEEKTRLQETLPERAAELTATQRGFLHLLAEALASTPWEDDALQSKVFEISRLTPIEQPLAFKAIYRVLLDREAGPKAGNLLAFLDPKFVGARFQEVPLDRAEFLREASVTQEELEAWLAQNKEKTTDVNYATAAEGALKVLEVTVTLQDGKRQLRRVVTPYAGDFSPGAIA
ncbi:MAG TPA: lysine--tRNA ligase [Chthoniobacteraceae bacterium]|jgi:lysyl-tRNA synthetase class 1|nr:lysine--tRNA ligase [Chthoniobacteraceae bacterium]